MSEQKQHVYFPNLDTIRFFAAISVVFWHLEQLKIVFNFKTLEAPEFFLYHITFWGPDAVTLFFVLSGFLITYLLLVEQNRKGEIDIRKFYLRRVLRILPLYYLLVFMGFIMLPAIEAATGFEGFHPLYDDSPLKVLVKFAEYLFILPHVGAFFGSFVTAIPQLWSIGVEENFYLVWPRLFRRFEKNLPRFLFAFIGVKVAIIIIAWLLELVGFVPEALKTLLNFVIFIHVESMAVGALGGYLLFKHKDFVQKWLFNRPVEIGVLFIMLANLTAFYAGEEQPLFRFLLSIVYLLFIMNACANEKFLLKLEHRLFNHLGKISYGIYMYHVMVMYLMMMALVLTGHTLTNSFSDNVLLYTLVTLGTIGVAHLSYIYFETPFLRLKSRFAVVPSGQHVEDTTTPGEPKPVVAQSLSK